MLSNNDLLMCLQAIESKYGVMLGSLDNDAEVWRDLYGRVSNEIIETVDKPFPWFVLPALIGAAFGFGICRAILFWYVAVSFWFGFPVL